jgi:hypothetical protein
MLQLGGREFEVISSGTIEWDVTLLNLLQGSGLADVTMHAGEDAEGLAFRVYRSLVASGAVFEVLGCVLIPAGSDPLEWRPIDMRQTADFIRKLHTPEDKAAVKSQITSLVASFFQHGLLSVRTFPTSSPRPRDEPEQPDPSLEANSTNGSASGP